MLNALTTFINERKAIRALSRLSDRELGDVGIARETIVDTVRRGLPVTGSDEPTRLASWAVQDRRSLAL